MTRTKTTFLAALLGVLALSGCATTSAALDGVGGVFIGAGQDIRSVGPR